MSDLLAHPIDAAIVDTLQQGLDGLPVSLPPASDVLTAVAAGTTASAVGTLMAAEDKAARPRSDVGGFLSRRWPYLAGAVLLVLAMVGVGAALQYRPTSGGSPSSGGPPVTAPSSGGSAGLGGGPTSSPAPSTSAPTPVPSATPPSLVAATPPPSSPAAAAPPAPVTSSTPLATPPPAATPTAAPTSAPTPSATAASTPCPHPNAGHGCPTTTPVP